MVKLNKIYTRTGDSGETGLVGGDRRAKHDLRVEAYGTVDEANAFLGQARIYSRNSGFDAALHRIQHDLFDLGADLATPITGEGKALRIIEKQVTRLEKEIDALNEHMASLDSFVLPGGTELSASLHVARTVVRRAERVTSALAEKEKINAEALKYLNRLSDFLFVLARAANNYGERDVLWEPGVNR